jgi:hypothetical protein
MYSSGQKRSSSPQITRTRDYPMASYHRGRSPEKHRGRSPSRLHQVHQGHYHHGGAKPYWDQTRYHHGSDLHHNPSRLHNRSSSPSRLHQVHQEHYHHSGGSSHLHRNRYSDGEPPTDHMRKFHHGSGGKHLHGEYKRLHVPEGTVGWGRHGTSYRVTGTCGCGGGDVKPQNYDVIDDEEDDDYDEGDEYRLKYDDWRGDDPIH